MLLTGLIVLGKFLTAKVKYSLAKLILFRLNVQTAARDFAVHTSFTKFGLGLIVDRNDVIFQKKHF